MGLFLGKTRDRGQAGGPGQPGALVVSTGRGSFLYIFFGGGGQKDSYLLGICPGGELAMKASKGLSAMVIYVQQNSTLAAGSEIPEGAAPGPRGKLGGCGCDSQVKNHHF